jgi:hypothetical protein
VTSSSSVREQVPLRLASLVAKTFEGLRTFCKVVGDGNNPTEFHGLGLDHENNCQRSFSNRDPRAFHEKDSRCQAAKAPVVRRLDTVSQK